jgi:peptidoglycan/xylan/chitin deacetylase (PgdA/CDA1 family)
MATDAFTILTYHSLDTSGSVISTAPQRFVEQMRCLAQLGVRGISLREALTAREATGRWPQRSIGLTFDDGYANLYEHALPELSRHGFTATVFLITDHVGGQNDWAPLPPGLSRLPMLSWAQVRELAALGIETGAHTRTHPDLGKLSEDEVTRELTGAQTEIAERVGQAAESFAYPFGSTSAVALRVAARQFRTACTTVLRRASNEPLYQLPRIDMYYIRKPRDLSRLLQGKLDRYLALRRWGRLARELWQHG